MLRVTNQFSYTFNNNQEANSNQFVSFFFLSFSCLFFLSNCTHICSHTTPTTLTSSHPWGILRSDWVIWRLLCSSDVIYFVLWSHPVIMTRHSYLFCALYLYMTRLLLFCFTVLLLDLWSILFFCAISATNGKKIKGIFYALSHDIFCGLPWKAWESGNCWFAVWVLTSHFCHSLLWKTQILFVSTRPVTGWHLCSAVFSKAEAKSLQPASRRGEEKKKPHSCELFLRQNTAQGGFLGSRLSLYQELRVCGT